MLQFKQEFFGDLRVLEKLEDQLDKSLLDVEVDGHDVGSSEYNIFIHTNNPQCAFDKVKIILYSQEIDIARVKAGYRLFSSNTYTPIWPSDLEKFSVI